MGNVLVMNLTQPGSVFPIGWLMSPCGNGSVAGDRVPLFFDVAKSLPALFMKPLPHIARNAVVANRISLCSIIVDAVRRGDGTVGMHSPSGVGSMVQQELIDTASVIFCNYSA